jgi:hypothetical protein
MSRPRRQNTVTPKLRFQYGIRNKNTITVNFLCHKIITTYITLTSYYRGKLGTYDAQHTFQKRIALLLLEAGMRNTAVTTESILTTEKWRQATFLRRKICLLRWKTLDYPLFVKCYLKCRWNSKGTTKTGHKDPMITEEHFKFYLWWGAYIANIALCSKRQHWMLSHSAFYCYSTNTLYSFNYHRTIDAALQLLIASTNKLQKGMSSRL